jgi:hypothetical protein
MPTLMRFMAGIGSSYESVAGRFTLVMCQHMQRSTCAVKDRSDGKTLSKIVSMA